jgi:hypothetical protein
VEAFPAFDISKFASDLRNFALQQNIALKSTKIEKRI